MTIKFALEMKNGVKARNIDELTDNFDIERIIEYYLDGKLKAWLDARFYEEEAEALSNLDKDDVMLAKKLCEIFGVEYDKSTDIKACAEITPYDNIEIDEQISVDYGQTQKFQNAIVTIEKSIVCEGTLEFDNCIIKYSPGDFCGFIRNTSAIEICGGILRFSNCRIEVEGEPEIGFFTGNFISCEDAKVMFDKCEINIYEKFISSSGSKIIFKACVCSKLTGSLITGSEKQNSIKILDCKLYASFEPHAPEDISSSNGTSALFYFGDSSDNDVTIDNSSFEGFSCGVVYNHKKTKISSSEFVGCSAILFGETNDALLTSCKFDKCINLLCADELKIVNCEFSACYGVIEACGFECTGCNWHDGLVFFNIDSNYSDNYSDCVFTDCSFKNIGLEDAFESLRKHIGDKAEFFSFVNAEDIDFTDEEEIDNNIRHRVFHHLFALIKAENSCAFERCEFVNIDLKSNRIVYDTDELDVSFSRCSFLNCKSVIYDEEMEVIDCTGISN